MALSSNNQSSSIGERHVLIVITGGTICMQESPDGLIPTSNFAHNLLIPSSDFHDGTEVEDTPAYNERGEMAQTVTFHSPSKAELMPRYKCSVLEFEELIDSSSMDGNHWNQIAKTLHMNWDHFDAFVVLHGTDTLAYTASMLSFVLGPANKSIIITGSQVSMYAPHNDAHDNLLDSLMFAAGFDIPEVSVVFHHHLYRATRVTKVSAFSMAAFTTPNAKPLATVRTGAKGAWSPILHFDSIKRTGAGLQTNGQTSAIALPALLPPLNTSQVAVLKVYPGISMSVISHIAEMPDLRGLILETFGAGNVPIAKGERNLLNILSGAVKAGIVVVSVTQCLTGSVTSAYESARRMERNGIVTGLDMTTEAAYTKLVYLLAQPALSRSQIANKMRENLRGELSADYRDEQRNQDSVVSSKKTETEAA